jgi:hypothetical protein
MEETNVIETVGPIVATAEPGDIMAEMDRRIRELESAIGDLRTIKAQGEHTTTGRKTLPTTQVSLLAKGSAETGNGASVDDALRTLSMEQRFAVKTGLIRAGLLR